ncbi:hypothetical protein FHX80_12618 [Streptomyces brevispora]|uniref:Uncharacterized protein n=1 Tax=Streptomyces brevispora TaxID=887462 RepID=A0A561TYW6_9ACTN|nr:hypothetical protein FHX80_12618 [Streptomyces brevispora]
MLSTLVGVAFLLFGVSLLGNFWNVAGRIFERVSDFVNDGVATVNTFRMIGVFVVVIGIGWVAEGVRQIL